MSDTGRPGQQRDFPGRGLVITLLRALHLAGVVGLGAAVLGMRPAAESLGYVALLMGAGIAMAGLERWSYPGYFSQLNGLTVLLKVLLLAGAGMLASFNEILFWLVLVGSVLVAHASRGVRHRKIF